MNRIACDSSSLISMSDNRLLWLLRRLTAEFVVPAEVRREIVDRPLKDPRFQQKAARIQQAILDGSIRVIEDRAVSNAGKEITELANSLFRYGDHGVKIVHGGEAESIALMKKRGVQTLLVDERATRLLIEDREALKEYIEHRTGFSLKTNAGADLELARVFEGMRVIRSSELVAWAYERGLLGRAEEGKKQLNASLYGLKYSGCSITNGEIEDYVKMLA